MWLSVKRVKSMKMPCLSVNTIHWAIVGPQVTILRAKTKMVWSTYHQQALCLHTHTCTHTHTRFRLGSLIMQELAVMLGGFQILQRQWDKVENLIFDSTLSLKNDKQPIKSMQPWKDLPSTPTHQAKDACVTPTFGKNPVSIMHSVTPDQLPTWSSSWSSSPPATCTQKKS